MMTFFGALVSIGNSGGIFEVVGWLWEFNEGYFKGVDGFEAISGISGTDSVVSCKEFDYDGILISNSLF
jgi:hypothetical protein